MPECLDACVRGTLARLDLRMREWLRGRPTVAFSVVSPLISSMARITCAARGVILCVYLCLG
jgi:hypothetical protein